MNSKEIYRIIDEHKPSFESKRNGGMECFTVLTQHFNCKSAKEAIQRIKDAEVRMDNRYALMDDTHVFLDSIYDLFKIPISDIDVEKRYVIGHKRAFYDGYGSVVSEYKNNGLEAAKEMLD